MSTPDSIRRRSEEQGGPAAGRTAASQDDVADEHAEQQAARVPGGTADKPQEIPVKGWFQIAKRGWKEAQQDNVPLMAAGVAFYAFLSIFPALLAVISIYGLVSTPEDVTAQIESIGAALPESARALLEQQLTQLVTASSSGLGWSLALSVALALYSASNGVGNLITAVNIAYDEHDDRGFIKRKALALVLTLGAIIVVVVALALLAVLPGVLNALNLSGLATFGIQVARWVGLLILITVALAVIYRVAPDRDAPKMRWVSVGAGIATALWLIVSVGFTLYANIFGYGSTYGALAGVVVLLMWLWLSSYAVLLGAEINAESEQQTVKDTTKGAPQPIGERNAVKADTVPA
ncbi:YihY/virulence factor BrkB family protein [Quadrisphaera sp. DSM 44207]|uniref:YihY/virulence factor BrkB family protein n=1 Tax=Quadrisphaera sp. DSM 44207 TaxID=1881057 RepID=UPI00088F43F2|nr:YihY/virulence factor BrkB family protein [Quadrisphaera sp. DSM 44207]SDQ88656.1 membrane protein [Quadrisphaera sp. DSM 44207]